MPGYPKGSLPDTRSPDWDLEIRAYREESVAPASQRSAAEMAMRDEERQGTRLAYPIVRFGGVLGFGSKGFPVPPASQPSPPRGLEPTHG